MVAEVYSKRINVVNIVAVDDMGGREIKEQILISWIFIHGVASQPTNETLFIARREETRVA